MASRERLLLLATPIVLSGCVRWGVTDDDAYGYDYGESVTYGYDESTSYGYDDGTTVDPDGSSTDEGPGVEPPPMRRPKPWPEQWLFGADSRLVTWGKSGIPTVNPELLANTFYFLAGVAPGERPLAILWIGDCDPRTDADGCQAGDVQPFFDVVDGLGTIEFAVPTAIEPDAYDVVIADFCGPVDGEWIAVSLAVGEGVLVLGDRSCGTADGSSAKVANETLAHFGVRFGTQVVFDPAVDVPTDAQNGLLEGVTSLVADGVSLHETLEPVVVVVETPEGVLLSRRPG
jgi:hypothetical protein